MTYPESSRQTPRASAFSLIEMVTVIAILTILMTAGVKLLHGTGNQARKSATDLLSSMIDQARASAIDSRSYIILAIAEPGDLTENDGRCRIGLFKLQADEWPQPSTGTIAAVQLSRWKSLETGVVLIHGSAQGIDNPLDMPGLTLSYGSARHANVQVRAIAFNPLGRLQYPDGSGPVALRVAEGNYRGGVPAPFQRGDSKTITESVLKIGRVTGRAYRID